MKLTQQQITDMAARVHEANKKWWVSLETGERIERNFGEMMMLCVSELAEALEGHRKNLMDDKLPHRKMIEVELADAMIRTLDILGGMRLPIIEIDSIENFINPNVGTMLLNLTYCYVRAELIRMESAVKVGFALCLALQCLVDMAEHLQLDIMGAYEEKMAYNAVRVDHQIEARKAADGKKY